jgi:mRNA interferase MazF
MIPDVKTIVLSRFPFTDLSGEKRRPALILAKSGEHDLIVAFISSVVVFDKPAHLVLDSSHPDFGKSGLRQKSTIRMDKIFTLHHSLITGELGELSDTTFTVLKNKLREVLDL